MSVMRVGVKMGCFMGINFIIWIVGCVCLFVIFYCVFGVLGGFIILDVCRVWLFKIWRVECLLFFCC